jgi:hypothetical protein
MKLINKLTGRESTQPQDMTTKQIVEIDKICTNLRCLITNSVNKQIDALKDIQTSIYCFYIEFATEELETEYLALSNEAQRQAFLDANIENYTETRDLHPNVKLLYTFPDEQNQIIDFVEKLEALVEANNNLPSDFYNAIDRLDAQ